MLIGQREAGDEDVIRKLSRCTRLRVAYLRLGFAFAWAFNLFFFAANCWIFMAYAALFGEGKTKEMMVSWLLASSTSWLVRSCPRSAWAMAVSGRRSGKGHGQGLAPGVGSGKGHGRGQGRGKNG